MLILYNPVSSASRKPVVPMSLLALGSMLEGKHDYVIVDGNVEDDPLQRISGLVREQGADILGVTVMPGPQLNHAAPLCKKIKALHPDLTIIWGGYFPTQHYEACLRSGYVDYVVLGCGEFAFEQLVDAIRNHNNVGSVPAVARIDGDKIMAGCLAEVPHPESLPDYPYDRIDTEKYLRNTFMGSRTISHHSSYGCPYTCDFCAVANVAGGKWVAQSGKRLAGVVGMLVDRFRVNAIEFYDNSFFIDEKRVKEFAVSIRPLDLGWWAEARIDRLAAYSDETWELMRSSGLKMVFMGAETGSDSTLKRMNKGGSATTEKTLLVAEKMGKHGIVPEFSFVLGNPPDPEGDVKETIAFIRKVKKINPAAEIIFYMYTPVPTKGDLYGRAREEGFRFPETLEEWTGPEWREFSQRRDINVPWLKPSLRSKVRDFECVLNAFYPTVTNPRLRGPLRFLLRASSAWRYKSGFYLRPLELKVLQKLLSYQRPETSGL